MINPKVLTLLLVGGIGMESCEELSLPEFEQTYTVIWQNDNGEILEIDREVIEDYKNRDLPIAVCLNEKDSYCDKYILIDGYHRFVANKDKRMMVVVVLE